MPPEAMALYARWWQLETWLRSLVYVELRARDGIGWANLLPPLTASRATSDRQGYMATPDTQARLAYMDTTPLFELLKTNWPLFSDALIDDAAVWSGGVIELTKIRHRIGHCRRPHPDDLGRLEQTLRDLEPGTFRAAAAFNRQRTPESDLADPMVDAWVREVHDDARRLVKHADRSYDVRFALRSSRRPWADLRQPDDPVSGQIGYLWHATWYLGRGRLDLRRFWEDTYLDRLRDLIVFVCADQTSVEVSFAAIDDPAAVADAIGNCFDAVMVNDNRGPNRMEWGEFVDAHSDLDPRVQVCSPWNIVHDDTVPITLFGAGSPATG